MTIALIVDDNKQTTDALVHMLKIWDIDPHPTLGPGEAMAILKENTPDVVFLDLNMPGVNGFELLSYIRREPRLKSVPVIVVTSDDQPETGERALKEGARAVILKPVMLDLLEAALKKIKIL